MRRARSFEDRGVVLIITALAMVALLLVVALVIDLGYLRGSSNVDQASADFAALAAAEGLSIEDFEGACADAVSYVNTNLSTSFNSSTFCGGMNGTTCTTPAGTAQATPSDTSGKYTLSIRFPVTDAEIAAAYGTGVNDGVPCERMRVIISSQEPSFFGGVGGTDEYTTTREATVRPNEDRTETVPALWILDPYGCVALGIDGSGTSLTVGDAAAGVRGIVTIDSDGTDPGCSSTTTTIDSSGTLKAIPASGPPESRGLINLNALPTGANSCVGSTACRQPQVGSNISPQPTSAGSRATRKYVDWAWNCKTGYPDYAPYGANPVVTEDCPGPADPKIDQLENAIGTSGQPTGFNRWTDAHDCNVSGTITVTGNWWVDCGSSGMRISNNNSVTFSNGNVVFDGGVTTTGSGSLEINTANGDSSAVPSDCTVPCAATQQAALAYVRDGDLDLNGPAVFNRTTVYLDRDSGVVMSAGSNPNWTAPVSGPFQGLALWGESSTAGFQISGNSDVTLTGTFFTPFADEMVLSGGGAWGQEAAQFISYRLKISGGSTLTLAPDQNIVISFPAKAGYLIR